MPDGTTHHKYYKMGWVVTLPASLVITYYKPEVGLGILIGYLLGNWIDPDLDQIGITNAEGRMVNDFKVVGTIVVGYSTIYGAVFRRLHRSFLTHFPVLSTSIRLVFFFWWLYFVVEVLYDWQILFGVGVLLGLSFADLIHYILDMLFPDIGKDLTNSNVKRAKKR